MKTSSLLLTGVILLFSILFSKQLFAQAGDLDLSFNTSDLGYGIGDGADGIIHATAVQSDGKIIIGGDFTSYNGTATNRIARLNTDGSLDLTFNAGGVASAVVYSVAIQNDGKIIIAGNFTARIRRLNTDGSLDATFNPGTGANNWIWCTAIQNDGKILIGGYFTSYNGTTKNRIARLNTDGSLDATFNTSAANNTVFSIAIQSDGKIIIGGDFTTYSGTSRNRIARLNTTGSLDATFNPGTGATHSTSITCQINSIALQSDGKILIGGYFTTYNGTTRNNIARVNTNGSLDATFNPGTGASSFVFSISMQSDGKVLIGGYFSTYNGTSRNRIARVNTDGSLDATFNPGNGANTGLVATNAPIYTTAIQSNGKIIIGGDFTVYNGAFRSQLARVNTDGSLDVTFNPGNGANSFIHSTAIQNDGKILIGGHFTGYNGTFRNRIARVNTDGSLDATFNSSTGTGANDIIYSISIQSDGKIIIGGNFTSYNGTGRNRIARLNTDGSLDATFNPGTGTNVWIHTTAIQSDGKILIGGEFSTYNGTTRNRIARLNTDGSLDATFDPGTGANIALRSMVIQSDGKIIIGGEFTTYNGTARNRIARLNTDGSLDATFNPGTGANNSVYSTFIQSDGKIIIGGGFTTYNGTARNCIARVNTNGSLDATFNPGTGANNVVYSTAIQGDGKFIIGGSFTSYNGIARNRIARLNTNGSLDANFDPGTGANSFIYSTSIQSDGKIIIGGDFTSYNGTGRNRIARVHGANPTASITTSPLAASSLCQGETIAVPYTVTGTYNLGNIFTVQLSDAAGSFASPTSIGTLTSITSGSITSVIPIATPAGTGYRVRVVSSNPTVIGSDNGSNLVVNSASSEIVNETACDSYIWALNGTTYTSSGTYTHVGTNANGCPLTTTLNLTINNSTTATVTQTACDSYTWALNGTTYTSSGTYTYVGTNANGCPLTTTLNLTINNSTTATVNQTACDSYTWALNGTTYTSSGTYTHVGTNGAGCSLTTTLNLTINSSTTATVTQTACDSYTWALNGTTYTTSGTYTHVGTNANGCPLTTTLNLTIYNSTMASVTETACDSYTWALNGTTYTTSGTYTHVGTNANGCTLTTTLNLTINNSTTATITETACDSYTWALNGTTYTTSGTYTHVGTNANGCPLTTTLNLTINNSTTATVNQTACDSYTWALNGMTYTSSGTYTHVGTNASGCTLTTTLNLTINNSTTATVTLTACDYYTWALNGTTYTSSGTYTHVGTNASGCPLTTTLNLTINNSTTATVNQTACDSYTWALNGTTYTNSGTYTHVGTNANGCPLTTTLNLTINNSTTTTVTETACDSYTWALNGTTYTSSGTYTHVGTNANGCPLTTILNLTINNSTTATVTETACDSYTWALNGTTYTSSGTYTHVGTNANGCPLTTTLNLTINTVDVSVVLSDPMITSNASGASYQWIDCGNGNIIIPGEIAQSFFPTSNGNYAVIVTTINCTDTSACQAINSVGLEEFEASNSDFVRVYPNPTNESVIISSEATFNKIEVWNTLGQKVDEQIFGETSNYTFTLPKESGVYQIKVHSNESLIIKRLIKR